MKVAVVTGAAQGIGRRTAEVLAAEGYALALLDLRSTEATLAAVRAAGVDATEYLGDVSDEGVVIRAART
ncbi:MAG: SDR family NAD(P)-dependent oxidoreductase, partial [Acidobacteriaceae bacterium]